MSNNDLENLIQQAKNLDLYQLEAGLGVMAKDMAEYLEKHPQEDAATFETIYAAVIGEIPKHTWEAEYLLPTAQTGLPRGGAEAAAQGQPDIEWLQQPGVIHEWTTMAGHRIWMKFRRKLRETVCGKGGPYEQFRDGLIGAEQLPQFIVTTVISVGFNPATFWIPISVYLSLITIKAGLKTYCE